MDGAEHREAAIISIKQNETEENSHDSRNSEGDEMYHGKGAEPGWSVRAVKRSVARLST